ncbi:MAG: hypothetical protein J7L89_08280 [Bacteroidales bacterium]|nr:hypothetical protein [Bacteroidales bacterium]
MKRFMGVLVLILFVGGGLFQPVKAQSKLQTSPGRYHGEMDFPWSWKRYYPYSEWTQMMKDIAKKYPQLATTQSIGKSRMGRDQYLITITNKKTGDDLTKTAMWVDGAIHGNEVNGITCSLYLAWYLLTRYDYDAYVHNLVDQYTFYILPGLNVDANASYVEQPNTENNPREPYRPEDNDGDGLYDEDQTEDVDGDGELSYMFVEDPKGDLKLSPDKRRFISIGDEKDYPGLRFKRIGSEGYDNDGDGLINEDDIGGPDPNRNYPYGWKLSAGDPYPMSENCTRNAYEFMLHHPNIFASFHYHNIGRLIMFAAPQPVKTSGSQAQQMSSYGRRGGRMTTEQRLAQMRKENKYAQLFDRQVPREFQHDLSVQTDIVTMGARILKNYTPVFGGLLGQTLASAYNMLGAYAYLIELWGSPTFDADVNNDGRVSDKEYMDWIDIELTGEGWIKPHPVDHPDLGRVWIGGSGKKHVGRTPPARYIESEALRNTQFVLYCASQFPKVEVDDIDLTDLGDGLYWVDVTVKNDHTYPTASDRSKKLKRIKQDQLFFSTSKNIELVPLDPKLPIIDPYAGRSMRYFGYGGGSSSGGIKPGTGKEIKLWLNAKDKQTYRYLVRKKSGKGWIEIKIHSERGGDDQMRKEI